MAKNYFFCGVGGSGMSSLAHIVLYQGNKVSGSDRSNDNQKFKEKFKTISELGITLYNQDGSGVNKDTDFLVVSSAIEPSIPDVKAAIDKNIKIIKRAELLAELFNSHYGIAIGGTSGKSTVTAMIGHIFIKTGKSPIIVNGAVMIDNNQGLGNAFCGDSDYFIIESDESDGSINLYNPQIAILNNITLDHKPVSELIPMFSDFLLRAKQGAVVNLDDKESSKLASINHNTLTFSLNNKNADILVTNIDGFDITAKYKNKVVTFTLPQIGKHNISNALAAIGGALQAGISFETAAKSLETFKGVQSRLQIVKQKNDITVIDDFAHNPDKIEASLKALKETKGRLIILFQLHGYGPAQMLKEGIIKSFVDNLDNEDILYMPEIYYAGGSANKSISAKDYIDEIKKTGKKSFFVPDKNEIKNLIKKQMKSGDRIIIMGARDDSLREMANSFL